MRDRMKESSITKGSFLVNILAMVGGIVIRAMESIIPIILIRSTVVMEIKERRKK